MSIQIRDPLALLPHQAGLIVAPLQEQAAEGQVDLDVKQKAIVIGEPVPIIFCLRASGNGGVMVSPGATEGRFENAAVTNTLTVNLELVLTEGNLVDTLTPSQLYQGNCRQGTWLRSYNRRAGSFTAGNFITAVAGTTYWNCPVECGTSGNYEDLTTLAFSNTYLDGDDTWSNQIHAFIGSGISVPRILVGTNGASSNIVDLALYLIRESSRYEESLLDLTAMTQAATFTNYNSFFYQGVYSKSSNLEDWLEDISISFLLRVTEKNGKKGLRPRLPFNANGSIKTTAITWVYGFTEEDVLPDGFEIEYIPLTDRQSLCVQVLWRQQPQNYAGLMRTLEVRMTGEASTGPFEQYDLSEFCTNETHAVKVGVYHAARRKYITHSLRLHVRPGSYNSTITQGDVVRVRLQRETSEDQISLHDYLYEVERIDRRFDGSVVFDLMHLPIDSQGRSIVAVAVNTATAPGYSYSTGPYTLTCSVNAGNTTPITDSGANLTLPAASNFEYNIGALDEAQPQGEIANPVDPFEGPQTGQLSNNKAEGEDITVSGVCPGAYIEWYRCPKGTDPVNADLVCTKVDEGSEVYTYTLTQSDIDHEIVGVGRCPDPSTPSGYGEPFVIGKSDPIEPDLTLYQYVRWTGTHTYWTDITGFIEQTYTSNWTNSSAVTQDIYIRGLTQGGVPADPESNGLGIYESIPVYAIPWRATVFITQVSNFGGGSGNYLGGFGGAPGFTGTLPWSIIINSGAGTTYAIQGTWEFSNDQSTVLRTWEGRDS